jgi:hypothetical protein
MVGVIEIEVPPPSACCLFPLQHVTYLQGLMNSKYYRDYHFQRSCEQNGYGVGAITMLSIKRKRDPEGKKVKLSP